jgi:general secretion pathway protein J
MAARRTARGFTLVELLVALFAMALLAIMSWRGLDGMVRVQQQTQSRADEVLALQVGLAQWAADLDALVQLPLITALEWNGRVLRLTRRGTSSATDGVIVVGWTRRNGPAGSQWLRWQSAPLTTRGEVAQAWERADVWSQTPSDEERRSEVAVTALADWQIIYYRGNAWTNPLSSDSPGAAPLAGGTGAAIIPDGVRLLLRLPEGGALSGELVRDWARPTVVGGGRG